MRADDKRWFELLLGEPEIVTWLEPDEHVDDDDEKSTAARRSRSGAGSDRGDLIIPGAL